MIELREVTLRARRRRIGPFSHTFEPGRAYAIVDHDGRGALLIAAIAGTLAPRKGTVSVAGARAAGRRTTAYVPLDPDLPAALRVDEMLRLSTRVRGSVAETPEARLSALDVESLARRSVGSLTRSEARAVALVEGLTSSADLLLLEDPLADLDPRAVARLAPALRRRVSAGATAILSTASIEDATALADEPAFLVGDALVSKGPLALPSGGRTRMVVRTDDAPALLACLSSQPAFDPIERDGAVLTLFGGEPVEMARAVSRGALEAGVTLELLAFDSGGPP